MKRLVINVLIVLSVSFSAAAYFYHQQNKILPKNPNPLREIVDFLETDTTNYDLIFIGSSRVYYHVDPEVIDSLSGLNSRCVAIDGTTIAQQYILLRKYMQHHRPPKMILLGLDYTSLQGAFLPYDYPNYYDFMNDSIFDLVLGKVDPRFRYQAFYKSYDGFILESAKTDYQKFAVLLAALGSSKKFDNLADEPWWQARLKKYKGYSGINNSWTKDSEKDLLRKPVITYDELGLKFFEDFIRTATGYSGRTAVFFSPTFIGYSKIADSQPLFSEISGISAKYNVPFWNYTTDTLCFDRKYFYTFGHLNKTGSEIFSSTLAGDIKSFMLNR